MAHGTALASLGELAIVAVAAVLVLTVPPSRHRLGGVVALILLVAAGSPPMHRWVERSLTGHMVQHLLLIAAAAPLMALATADRGPLARFRPLRPVIARAVSPGTAPAVAGLAHGAVLTAWHVPVLYDTALASDGAHIIGHLALGGTAVWWWTTVLHHVRRRRLLPPLLTLFGLATWCAVLGVALMFGREPWFVHGHLGDQQTAGALMAGAGVVYGSAALVLVSRSVAMLSRPRPVRFPPPSGLLAVIPLALALPALQMAPDRTTEAPSPTAGTGTWSQVLSDEPADPGRDLYRRDCASCHGDEGQGSFRGVAIAEVGTASVRYSLETGRVTGARLYGHDPDDGVGGAACFFLLLDDPEVYRLPVDPVVTTRRLGAMWATAGAAALAMAAVVAATIIPGIPGGSR